MLTLIRINIVNSNKVVNGPGKRAERAGVTRGCEDLHSSKVFDRLYPLAKPVYGTLSWRAQEWKPSRSANKEH